MPSQTSKPLLAVVASLAALALESQAQAQTLPAPPVSPAPVVNYEYDANGNPTRAIQAPGVAGFAFATTRSYDALNRLKDSTDARSGVTRFDYNGREDHAAAVGRRADCHGSVLGRARSGAQARC